MDLVVDDALGDRDLDGGKDVDGEDEEEKGGRLTCSSSTAPASRGLGLLAALGLAGLMVRRRR